MSTDVTWPWKPNFGELAGRSFEDPRAYRAALTAARERRYAVLAVLHKLLDLFEVTVQHGDAEGHANKASAQVIEIMVALATSLSDQQ